MDDLISRQAAIDALEREKTYCTAFRDGYTPINVFEKYNDGLTDGIKALKNLPSADVAERREGEWNVIWGGEVVCSECKMNAPEAMRGCLANRHLEQIRTNFCPNCGADMRGEINGNQ